MTSFPDDSEGDVTLSAIAGQNGDRAEGHELSHQMIRGELVHRNCGQQKLNNNGCMVIVGCLDIF